MTTKQDDGGYIPRTLPPCDHDECGLTRCHAPPEPVRPDVLRQIQKLELSANPTDWALADMLRNGEVGPDAQADECLSATETGPLGDPRCPECQNSLDHGRPAGSRPDLYCCANCKLLFKWRAQADPGSATPRTDENSFDLRDYAEGTCDIDEKTPLVAARFARSLETEAQGLRRALADLLPVAESAINQLHELGESNWPAGNISELLSAQAALADGKGEW